MRHSMLAEYALPIEHVTGVHVGADNCSVFEELANHHRTVTRWNHPELTFEVVQLTGTLPSFVRRMKNLRSALDFVYRRNVFLALVNDCWEVA